MTSVIHKFEVTVFATTRDECVEALDRAGLAFLNEVGGAPWVTPDDDTKKVSASNVSSVLADDHGFCYVGMRSFQFRGPIIEAPNQNLHDGFNVQASHESSHE